MKTIFYFFFTVLVFSTTCCQAQKMVKSVSEARKLQVNVNQFVGKPLKELLEQIGPEIKYAYGNPDNKGESIVGTNIKFYFVDRSEYRRRQKLKEKPTSIRVTFETDPNSKLKPLPIGGIEWTKEMAIEYGNMIIMRIYVTGED